MADLKISQLTAASTPITGAELVPIVQSGVTKKVAAFALNAGPSFSAYMLNGSANQGISSATFTKIKIDTEVFDTAACYDPATYRFTPNVAGYYQISGGMSYSGSTAATRGMLILYKNGSGDKRFGDMVASGNGMAGSTLVYMNGTTDYVELYAFVSATTAVVDYGPTVTWFTGAFVRGA